MTDALPILPQSVPLLEPVRNLKHPRAGHMVMRRFDAVHDIPHLGAGTFQLRITREEEGLEVVGREMPEGTAVRVLRARLVLREDLLAARKRRRR